MLKPPNSPNKNFMCENVCRDSGSTVETVSKSILSVWGFVQQAGGGEKGGDP